MKGLFVFLFAASLSAGVFADHHKSDTKVAKNTEKTDAPPIQLSPGDRIPEEEAKFIESIKAAIKKQDKEAIKALYYLENASPAYLEYLPYTIDSILKTDLSISTFEIEPNTKASDYNMRFTVPYLGTLYIKSQSEYGRSQMGIPVGIKDGKYYLTIGAAG